MASTQLSADVRAPAVARTFVSAEIARTALLGDIAVADVVLVASELVTNAVKAGSTSVGVTLRIDGGSLELSVEDDAPGSPIPQHATPESVGGRGLGIVAELADRWITSPTGGSRGKRVSAIWDAGPA